MSDTLKLIIIGVAGYLLGSLNFAIILSKIRDITDDVRHHGSGNAGATNMLRSYGTLLAIITLIGDGIKCIAAVLMARSFMPGSLEAELIAATLCIIGHCFPLYFGFRGGKGIMTAAAMALVIDWRLFIIVLVVFAAVVALTRYVSLSSICAAVSFAIGSIFVRHGETGFIIWAFCIALFLILLHHQNIKRLASGTEPKLSFKKK
ncbi:MAG: glycerol-3-phosphate 1-O-acyltransferase PlsY [Bacillota bacterium]|nr:glycerol-3-phosphate 1-O-acyltransferase PlsY [Bacillota bacterium]